MKRNNTTLFIILFFLLIGVAVVWNYRGLVPGPELPVASSIATSEISEEDNDCSKEDLCLVPEVTAEAPGSNILALEPRVFDLGTVVYGQVATYTIQLTNLSSAPLKILQLSTSCGCTKAQMAEKDKIIPPGATVPLLVSFDPAIHQDDTDVGLLKRVVYINTDHLEAPELSAEFTALVIK